MAMKPMTIEIISQTFKKEIASLKHETELKFDFMTAMFQSQLQLLIGNQASFFLQVQNEIKTSERQTRSDLKSLIEEVLEFKSTLKTNILDLGGHQLSLLDNVSPLTSGSDVPKQKKGRRCFCYFCVYFYIWFSGTNTAVLNTEVYKPVVETYNAIDVYWSQSLAELHPEYENIIKDSDLLIQLLNDKQLYDDTHFSALENLR
jgi:hypothetical protein